MRGKLIEDYLQLARSNVLFYDGLNFKICQNKLQYANGINISKDLKTLYITESIGKKVTVYNRDTKSNDINLVFSEMNNNVWTPNNFSLKTYPNPFNASISINFYVAYPSFINTSCKCINSIILYSAKII